MFDEKSVKEKVLQEIIDLMDQRETDGLKKKSPKFMAMSVEVAKPKDGSAAHEEAESPMKEKSEGVLGLDKEDGEPELDAETIKKLLEQLAD